MIITFQIDTTLPIGPQLDAIAELLHGGIQGARDEAHTDATDPDHDGDWGYDVKPEPEPVRRCGYCRGSLVLPGAYCSDSCEGLDKDRRDPRPASTIAADSGAVAGAVKKPRKVKATIPECFDPQPIASFIAVEPRTIGELEKQFGVGADLIHAVLKHLGAVKTGKARGTRYSLASETVDAYGDE